MSVPAGPDPMSHRIVRGATGLLRVFNEAGVLDAADVHTAARLTALGGEPDESVALAVALAVRAVRGGSVCVDLHAVAGEVHELGCPVEICPWCGGQLIHCDCRFERLGLDAITSEEELLQFEAMLEEQGRIPYSREQRPAFADDGPPVLFD